MQRIFIFNPETDYALAIGRSHYSVPLKIRRLRSDLQLIQAQVAHTGDAIVVDDDFSPDAYPHPEHLQQVERKHLTLIPFSDLHLHINPEVAIVPWGWNHTLIRNLSRCGLTACPLFSNDSQSNGWHIPADDDVDRWRALSHRRTAIDFRQRLARMLADESGVIFNESCEFMEVRDAVEFAANHREVYFKAPWSSSGRGVATSSGFRSPDKMKEWLSGCIKSQGSVTAEIGLPRKADFASEWIIANGKADFRGLSLFATTDSGKYLGNHTLPYADILSRLISLTLSPEELQACGYGASEVAGNQPEYFEASKPESFEASKPECFKVSKPELLEATKRKFERIFEAQKSALESLVAPGYEGPVGIDMLIAKDGSIYPCVELNLRLTMGMMALGESFYPD